MVNSSARGRAQADAQGRGDDGAGSEESIGNQPSGGDEVALRGFWFYKENHTFFGEVSEELGLRLRRTQPPVTRCFEVP